ncbi:MULTISPECIES: hypothetical protein [Pseudanabaena]|uniref:Uncharacterized protein n=2 Tax=Pseudanabaena TaxID=1152 RepID=L8MSK5_9CYAN|nr:MULTISPECIES: hypothetical protein [Pseudanabaena]ELS30436.1 hypothetical protein Pse7429DRAFT_4463 [Pseudanabaena biceps PCC 7429]MDG3497290.1 hypothetical protein [Pseudanabaena catenata USMAC16]
MELIEKIILALPSIIIAGIVAYIAYQQYEINRQKLKLDLYDRRFKIYSAAIALVRFAYEPFPDQRYKDITEKIDNEFTDHLSAAYFLLNREAFNTLEQISQEVRDLASAMESRLSTVEKLNQLQGANTEECEDLNNDRRKWNSKIESIRQSLSKTHRINSIFLPYLDFRSLYYNHNRTKK